MAKKLPKAQRGIDPGFSKPGRSTSRPNDPGFSKPGTNIPNNDPGFARGSKKDVAKGIVKGIVGSPKPKSPELEKMDDLLRKHYENQKRQNNIDQYLRFMKGGGPVTALDQVQRMYSKKKK